jgi:hypothetical protein
MTLARASTLRYGAHSGINDFTSTPGTLIFLEPESIDAFAPRSYNKLERNQIDAFNYRKLALNGAQKIDEFSFDCEAMGIAGTGVEALANATGCNIGPILASVFGSVTDASSTGSTVSSSTTTAVTVASGTNYAVGQFVSCQVNADGTREVRQIASISTNVLTLDRALSAAAVTSSQVWRSIRYQATPDVPMRTPLYFDAEQRGTWRNIMLGCIPSSAVLKVPEGERAMWTLGFMPNSWDGDEALATPSVTLPTSGSPIIGLTSSITINTGSPVSFMVRDLEVDLGITVAEKKAQYAGGNGRYGVAVMRQDPKIKCKLYMTGSQTVTGGIAISGTALDFQDLIAGGGLDVLLQIGQARGAWGAARMVNADCTVSNVTNVDGLAMVECEFTSSRPASGNGYPFQFALG